MVRNYFTALCLNWKESFASNKVRNQLIILVFLYYFLFKYCRKVMTVLETRDGIQLMDPALFLLPTYNLSEIIFTLTYTALGTFLIATIKYPKTFIIGLQGYCLLIIMRTLSIYLVPLNPPAGMILLKDPVSILFLSTPDGGYIVKDLFFSGHVSTVILFFFVSNNKKIKQLLLGLACILSLLLLVQHVHYTIDIIAAPFFAFLAYKGSLYWNKMVYKKQQFALKAVN